MISKILIVLMLTLSISSATKIQDYVAKHPHALAEKASSGAGTSILKADEKLVPG